jgi:hypothetical protein
LVFVEILLVVGFLNEVNSKERSDYYFTKNDLDKNGAKQFSRNYYETSEITIKWDVIKGP